MLQITPLFGGHSCYINSFLFLSRLSFTPHVDNSQYTPTLSPTERLSALHVLLCSVIHCSLLTFLLHVFASHSLLATYVHASQSLLASVFGPLFFFFNFVRCFSLHMFSHVWASFSLFFLVLNSRPPLNTFLPHTAQFFFKILRKYRQYWLGVCFYVQECGHKGVTRLNSPGGPKKQKISNHPKYQVTYVLVGFI